MLKFICYVMFLFFYFFLLEIITLLEEYIQVGFRDGIFSIFDLQVIESGLLDEGQVEVIFYGYIIEEGQVIELGDGVMLEEEEEEENEEDVEQEEMIVMEYFFDLVVEDNLLVGEDFNMQII